MGIKVILFMITFIILGFNSLILAQDNSEQVIELEKQVANNISSEFVVCAAYFQIVTEAVQRGGDKELAEVYSNSTDQLLIYGMLYTSIGRSEELAQKVMKSRFEFFVNSMLDEIENDFGNISILMNKHQTNCVDMVGESAKIAESIRKETTEKFLNK